MEYSKAKNIVENIKYNIKGLYCIGSYKRKDEIIKELDFLTTRELQKVWDDFNYHYECNIEIFRNDYMQIKIKIDIGFIFIEIWKAEGDYDYNFLKWMRTITKEQNNLLVEQATKKGLILDDRGLKNNNNQYYGFANFKRLKKFLLN